MLQSLLTTLFKNPILLLPLISVFFLSTSALYHGILVIYDENNRKETLVTASIASLALVFLFANYLFQNF